MAYNKFCAKQNFNANDGFPEEHDKFFTFYNKNVMFMGYVYFYGLIY